MGGSVNLQGGGQYSMPNIQGYGQNAANIGQSAAGFGSRFGNRGYGPPPQYDGGYGDYGDYGGVSTGGKGFQQQPQYQPAPVMQPYVDQVSQGGKGFQPRQTPSQSVAYAPMNIPQMQLAQPGFYYPNIGSQMANLNANYGMGGLGAMGAFGNYPMMMRQPAPMQMYPALQPAAPPTSTGGKGMRTKPPGGMQPSRPGYGPPTQPGYPPVGTGGKGFQPNPPFQPPTQPTYPNEPDIPDYGKTGGDDVLRPVRPEDVYAGYRQPGIGSSGPEPMPQYDEPPIRQPDYFPTRRPMEEEPFVQPPTVPSFEQNVGYAAPGLNPQIAEEYDFMRDRRLPDFQEDSAPNNPMYAQPTSYQPQYAYAGPTSGPRIAEEYDRAPIMEPDYYPDRNPLVTPAQEVQPTDVETTMPTYEQDTVDPFMGLNQRDLID